MEYAEVMTLSKYLSLTLKMRLSMIGVKTGSFVRLDLVMSKFMTKHGLQSNPLSRGHQKLVGGSTNLKSLRLPMPIDKLTQWQTFSISMVV